MLQRSGQGVHCIRRNESTCEEYHRRNQFEGCIQCDSTYHGSRQSRRDTGEPTREAQRNGEESRPIFIRKKAVFQQALLELALKKNPQRFEDLVLHPELHRNDLETKRWIIINYKQLINWASEVQEGWTAVTQQSTFDELKVGEDQSQQYMLIDHSVDVLKYLLHQWDEDPFKCKMMFAECVKIFDRANVPPDRNTVFCTGQAGTGKTLFVQAWCDLAKSVGEIGQCDVQNTQFVFCNLPNKRLIKAEELHCGLNIQTVNMLKKILGGQTTETPLKGKNESGTIYKTPVFATGNEWILRPELDPVHGAAMKRRILQINFPPYNKEILLNGGEFNGFKCPRIYGAINPNALHIVRDYCLANI